MKNRILSFLLAAVLLGLSGCDAKSSVPETTAAPAETVLATETATLPPEEVHSEDWEQIHTLANLFAAAYFDGSETILKSFLAESFQGSPEVFSDAFGNADPNVISIKGLDGIGDMEVGSVCHPSIEFFSGIEGDSYSYLSMTFIKEESGWKVQSYGLEK